MQYIGIDLGTSSVKLLLMQNDGTVLSSVSKEYPVSYPNPGWSKQNPEDWLRQTLAGLTERSVRRRPIKAKSGESASAVDAWAVVG